MRKELIRPKTELCRLTLIVAFYVCLGGPVWLSNVAHAEYTQGVGNVEDATREASAKLNDALSEFHLMLAALDRRELAGAERHRAEVLNRLQLAANAYESAKPDEHILRPIAKTDDERQFIEYFRTHAESYGIRQSPTQSELVLASSRLIREFASRIRSLDIKQLNQRVEERQVVANYSADLQKFLLSATTILILG